MPRFIPRYYFSSDYLLSLFVCLQRETEPIETMILEMMNSKIGVEPSICSEVLRFAPVSGTDMELLLDSEESAEKPVRATQRTERP